MHLWNKAVSAISRFFQSEEENTWSLVLEPIYLTVGILAGFKGLIVRKFIPRVIQYVSSSDEKENSGSPDFPDSSDMLTQPAQTSCIDQNFSPGW